MLVLTWVLHPLGVSDGQTQIIPLPNRELSTTLPTTMNSIQVDSDASGFTAAVICLEGAVEEADLAQCGNSHGPAVLNIRTQ